MGKYQVIMTFLLIIQASSNFILLPFVKNIYRLSTTTIMKIGKKLFLAGIAISFVSVTSMDIIVNNLYHIETSFWILTICFLFVLPAFYYLPIIYLLFKFKQPNKVIVLNVVSIFSGFILNIFLIN